MVILNTNDEKLQEGGFLCQKMCTQKAYDGIKRDQANNA